jgi:TolB-like protein
VKIENFFSELKRRNVYKVAVAYAVVAWLLIQAASIFFPAFDAPPWVMRIFIIVIILGFPVALILSWAFEITLEGIKLESEIDPNKSVARRTGRKIVAVTVALAVVAAGLLAFQLLRSKSRATAAISSAISNATAEIPAKTIAVLPFDNLSEDKANAYFVTGMRDEILTKLAQLQDLKLVSRTSTDKFQSHPEDTRSVSRELNVAHVLEGSVQKRGDDVLINVQLIDARSENHLWAQSYRRSFSHIFDIEAEVASEVVDALNVRLAPAEAQRLRKAATESPRAHDLFLRARALNNRSDEQSFRQAITLLEEAVREDPDYAAAWAQMANTYVHIADAYSAPIDVLGPMRHAALQAVRADEKAGSGHVSLGAVALLYDRNFPLAKHELERAVVLDPNSPDAHQWLGRYLAMIEKKFVSGRREVQRARALDPLNPWPVWFEMRIATAEGSYDNALDLAREILAIDPHFFYEVDPLANVYVAMARWDQAVKRYESLPPDLLRRPNFDLAVAYSHTGRTEDARRILADLESLATKVYIDKVQIAAVYAALGDGDRAFAALREAAADRAAMISAPRFFPWLAPLFDDPRFAQFEYDISHSAIGLPADEEAK